MTLNRLNIIKIVADYRVWSFDIPTNGTINLRISCSSRRHIKADFLIRRFRLKMLPIPKLAKQERFINVLE